MPITAKIECLQPSNWYFLVYVGRTTFGVEIILQFAFAPPWDADEEREIYWAEEFANKKEFKFLKDSLMELTRKTGMKWNSERTDTLLPVDFGFQPVSASRYTADEQWDISMLSQKTIVKKVPVTIAEIKKAYAMRNALIRAMTGMGFKHDEGMYAQVNQGDFVCWKLPKM